MVRLTKKIYIFSGLGADERVFQKLDFTGFSPTFIKWTIPHESETIENYAKSLLNQIPTEKPILIGLSFGGIIAVEVAKQIETEQVILIASAKTKYEIPPYLRIIGQLGIHKFLQSKYLKQSNFISNWFFGTTSNFDKQTLKAILNDTNPVFLKWAIDEVLNWNNKIQLKNIKHIHGTIDRILPINYVNCDYKINKGGHFMTLNKAEKITQIIKTII